MLRRGTRLGKYRLECRLGRGAFSDVWRARDTIENRRVALKIPLPEVIRDHGRAAVEYEARIAASLDHPNIVGLRNADWCGSRLLLASDLAARSLASYPAAKRSGKVALRVLRDVAAGLAHAHAHRIMHRDVKPENILIFDDGRAALADFGVSRFAKSASETFTEAGTLGYLAPEQAYGRPCLASDVFSLGMIALEMLTGTLPTWPFHWPPENEKRFNERVPPELRPILRKAAEFHPEKRWPDAVAFHAALEAALERTRRKARDKLPARKRRSRRDVSVSPLAVQAELFRKRHGARLDMRVSCYRCELPVAEHMRYCPWCGFADNAFSEVSAAPLVCPDCERGVLPEWSYCPWCYSGRFVSNGKPPKRDPKATRTCTRKGCEGQLRPFMKYCPLCKQKVRRAWVDPELPDRCSGCGWSIDGQFWHHCPWCGRHETRARRYRHA